MIQQQIFIMPFVNMFAHQANIIFSLIIQPRSRASRNSFELNHKKMKKIIQVITFTTFLILLLTSCDPGSIIKYEIWNKTNKLIKVKYEFISKNSKNDGLCETMIEPNKLKIVHEESHLGYARQFNESHDSIDLYSMTIIQDSLMTVKNFKDKQFWIFETEGDFNGIYKLTVEKTIFNSNYKK